MLQFTSSEGVDLLLLPTVSIYTGDLRLISPVRRATRICCQAKLQNNERAVWLVPNGNLNEISSNVYPAGKVRSLLSFMFALHFSAPNSSEVQVPHSPGRIFIYFQSPKDQKLFLCFFT